MDRKAELTAVEAQIKALAQFGVVVSLEERDVRIELNRRVEAGDKEALREMNILNFGKP